MPQPVVLTSSERDAVERFAHRLKAARLRRNISQEQLAERAGVTRKTIADLENGKPTVGFSIVVKAMGILGYLERIPGLLETDPLGEDLGLDNSRRHAGSRRGFADF